VHTLFSQLFLFAFCSCVAAETTSEKAVRSDAASTARPTSSSTALGGMLPRPRESFTLRATPERAPSLHDAVVELEKATGVHFVVSDEARAILRASSSGLLSDLEVPPSEAWRVVETMLALSDVVLVPSNGTAPVTITLHSVLAQDSLKGFAVPIDASNIEECADHPAVLFSTVVDTAPMDARQLSTSLRQLFPDQRTQSILPVSGSQMMLTGFGPELLTAVRMIRESASGRRSAMDDAEKTSASTDGVSPR